MNIGCLAGLPFAVTGPSSGAGLPFVEPVHRDDASAILEHALVRRLLGQRLGAGVDHLGPDLAVLGPRRDQAPVERLESQRAVGIGDDAVDVVGRRDVVVLAQRLAVERGAEVLGDRFGGTGGDEAATHAPMLPDAGMFADFVTKFGTVRGMRRASRAVTATTVASIGLLVAGLATVAGVSQLGSGAASPTTAAPSSVADETDAPTTTGGLTTTPLVSAPTTTRRDHHHQSRFPERLRGECRGRGSARRLHRLATRCRRHRSGLFGAAHGCRGRDVRLLCAQAG